MRNWLRKHKVITSLIVAAVLWVPFAWSTAVIAQVSFDVANNLIFRQDNPFLRYTGRLLFQDVSASSAGIGISTGPVTLGACGTATVSGVDSLSRVVITAATPTSCTVNFSRTFGAAPACWYQDITTAGAEAYKVTSTTSTVVVTAATTFTGQAANLGADTIDIFCLFRS